MSRKAIVGAVLSAIAMAASGCSGDSDVEAESPPATTTEQVETQPPAQRAVDIAKFRVAFKETYGTPPDERPWYGLITGMKLGAPLVSGGRQLRVLDVTMKLSNIPDTLQGTICEAVFTLDSEMGNGIDAVRVINADGGDGGCA
jgi:hypothetical protein